MTRRGCYYLSRVLKAGQLNQESLIESILRSETIYVGKYAWTIIDTKVFPEYGEPLFVFGKLSKHNPVGTVSVVEENLGKPKIEPNLIEASSPFVYIPQFSGIAFLHVWNKIERDIFANRFSRIIEEKFYRFFVECTIEPITNLEKFLKRIQTLESYQEITAKVTPPNPLFGEAWRSLREYLEKRNLGELRINEQAEKNGSINTDLPKIINGILNKDSENPYSLEKPIDITDASVLMATDGYGDGKIVGKERSTGRVVLIRISEKHLNFLFDVEPDPEALFEEAYKQFIRINIERDMNHL